MPYIDFMSVLHKSTQRDYLARVNDPDYPKAKAAELAKRWGYDYWDGDRRINYGGYRYLPGRWEKVARRMVDHYGLMGMPREAVTMQRVIGIALVVVGALVVQSSRAH